MVCAVIIRKLLTSYMHEAERYFWPSSRNTGNSAPRIAAFVRAVQACSFQSVINTTANPLQLFPQYARTTCPITTILIPCPTLPPALAIFQLPRPLKIEKTLSSSSPINPLFPVPSNPPPPIADAAGKELHQTYPHWKDLSPDGRWRGTGFSSSSL